jgi:hypothetical protein
MNKENMSLVYPKRLLEIDDLEFFLNQRQGNAFSIDIEDKYRILYGICLDLLADGYKITD